MKGRCGVIFAVLGFIVFFAIEARASDWKFFTKNTAGEDYFYDTQSVSREQDIASVWVKMILSDKEKANVIKKFPQINGIKNISYSICKYEIHCSKNFYRAMALAFYSSEGDCIYSARSDEPREFRQVFPDSVVYTLVEAICKKGEKMEARAVDWVLYGTTEYEAGCYYDSQSIKPASKDTVRVWTKNVFTEKGVQGAIKNLGPKYKELSYGFTLLEYNCSEKKVNILSINYYTRDGNIIPGPSYGPSFCSSVVPGSSGELLFNIVCGSR